MLCWKSPCWKNLKVWGCLLTIGIHTGQGDYSLSQSLMLALGNQTKGMSPTVSACKPCSDVIWGQGVFSPEFIGNKLRHQNLIPNNCHYIQVTIYYMHTSCSTGSHMQTKLQARPSLDISSPWKFHREKTEMTSLMRTKLFSPKTLSFEKVIMYGLVCNNLCVTF